VTQSSPENDNSSNTANDISRDSPTASSSTSTSPDPGPVSSQGRIGPGFIGLGFIGAGGIVQRALAAAVRAADGVQLQAVAARSLERAAALQPAGRSYDDYDALLADPSVDLVYVTLDNAGHLPWTLAALDAGKHVLCEKPLGLDPAALETMIAAATRNDRLLVEAFWYRWHPRTRRLEQLLSQGALGPVREVDAGFSYSGPADGDPDLQYRLNPARGGGGIYDVGCYAVSAAHLALGPDLTVARATARRGPSGVDVEASAQLITGDRPGATALIHCGISAADRQVIKVTGQAATVEFGEPVFTTLHESTELTITTGDGAVRREQFAPVDAYRLMVEAVAARIRGEDSFLPGHDHSRQVAATTAAIFAAL
jgi:D-xylose 1-dehydrogenase (NADP+, D-xylono-1,5-lactone-forming)